MVNLVIVLIAIVVAVILVVSWVLSGFVVAPKILNPDECYIEEIKKGKIDKDKYEKEYHREDFRIESSYGYQLFGSIIPRKPDMVPKDNHERAVILVHGYTFCQFGSVKYIDIFRNLGFNCIIYDHRNHGYSGKATTSMGYFEARDLKLISDWTREKLGEDTIVGTHGESMGAATVMINASLDDKLAFVIEDCGYSALTKQLAYKMKTLFHLPCFPFLSIASLFSKLRGGVWFSEVVPKNEIAKCEHVPMLFIHGEMDDYVPPYMVDELFDAKKGKKRKKTFPNASHAESYWNNQIEYTKEVEDFLKENKIIEWGKVK